MTTLPDKPPLQSNVNWKEWDAATTGVKQTRALRQVNAYWFGSLPYRLDVAVALHLPKAFRADRGASERAFQYKLRHFFTRLDRKVLKSACRKRKEKIPRFVVLEHSASLGWHMHALLSSETSNFNSQQLCMTIKLMWLEEFGQSSLKGFEPHMAWAEPAIDGYDNYMSKDLYGPQASMYASLSRRKAHQ